MGYLGFVLNLTPNKVPQPIGQGRVIASSTAPRAWPASGAAVGESSHPGKRGREPVRWINHQCRRGRGLHPRGPERILLLRVWNS